MKSVILRLVGIGLVLLAVGCRSREPVPLSQLQVIEAFQSNWITRAQIIYDPQSLLHEVRGQMLKPGERTDMPFVAKVRLTEKMEKEMLASGRFEAKQGR